MSCAEGPWRSTIASVPSADGLVPDSRRSAHSARRAGRKVADGGNWPLVPHFGQVRERAALADMCGWDAPAELDSVDFARKRGSCQLFWG